MRLVGVMASLGVLVSCATVNVDGQEEPRIVDAPSFQVDCPMPTADKPQSKLWFEDGCWWALLPRASGPSLWQRTPEGWREHADVGEALTGLPGSADVWPDRAGVIAVAVKTHRKENASMTVFRLDRKPGASGTAWTPRVLAELMAPSADEPIETATIMQDTKGVLWVAAVAGTKVCVWASASGGSAWAEPIVLAEGIKDDDICVVTPLADKQIAVIWSDQGREGVFTRSHSDDAPADEWDDEVTVQAGGRCADDHLNTALAPDGTLWVASKNEVDTAGMPQFVLRVRTPEGRWSNVPYGVRGETFMMSRPIVVATEENSHVFTAYGTYDNAKDAPRDARLVFSQVNPEEPTKIGPPRDVVIPAGSYQSFVQNVTGPRKPFPKDGPWIVLVSDNKGRVYEADLRLALSSTEGD